MKIVLAVIQPTKLDAVRQALRRIAVTRLTICDAQGYARQLGHDPTVYRGVEASTNLVRKVVLEIVINDDFLERTIETISAVARSGSSGHIGDGKIFVLPALDVIEIRDSLTGPEAV